MKYGRPAPVPMNTASKPSSRNSSSIVYDAGRSTWSTDLDAQLLHVLDLARARSPWAAGTRGCRRRARRPACAAPRRWSRAWPSFARSPAHGEPGRAGADHGDALAGRRRRRGRLDAVRRAPSRRQNRSRRPMATGSLLLAQDADEPRTAPPAGRRGRRSPAGVRFLDLADRAAEVALRDEPDEPGDVDLDRAAGNARLLLALQAALGLAHGLLFACSRAAPRRSCARGPSGPARGIGSLVGLISRRGFFSTCLSAGSATAVLTCSGCRFLRARYRPGSRPGRRVLPRQPAFLGRGRLHVLVDACRLTARRSPPGGRRTRGRPRRRTSSAADRDPAAAAHARCRPP